MSLFLLNVLLAIAWGALTGNFEPENLIGGFILAYLILWLAFSRNPQTHYFQRFPKAIEFILFMAWEIFLANLRVAVTVLSPRPRLRPAVVGVPLSLKSPAEISLLMNLLTLTPGTLSLDVSSDRKILFIHTLWLESTEEFIQKIKQDYERRIMELFE